MCVIVVKEKKATFSEADFRQCWKRNSDGFGCVILKDDKLVFEIKGIMNENEALAVAAPFMKKGYCSIFHFRIQSVGKICPELTHPFPFSTKTQRRFLFHNGTVRHLLPNNEESDSLLTALLLTGLNDNDADKLLMKLSGSSGRFVTAIEKNGKFNVTIYGDTESQKHHGVWYSNMRHLQPAKNRNPFFHLHL